MRIWNEMVLSAINTNDSLAEIIARAPTDTKKSKLRGTALHTLHRQFRVCVRRLVPVSCHAISYSE